MALTDNLVAYWQLEESSGTRADAVGSHDLAVLSSAPGGTTGVLTNCVTFDGADDALETASHANLQGGDADFTIAGWVYCTDTSMDNFSGVWTKWTPTLEYALLWHPDGWKWFVSTDGSDFPSVTHSGGTPPTTTWQHIVCWHDASANQIGLAINGGTADTASHSAGVYAGTTTFKLGVTGSDSHYFKGRIDSVGVWRRVLTSGERTSLYGGGSGLEYPFGGGAPSVTGPLLHPRLVGRSPLLRRLILA